jgi:Tfp pilus assembly protein PilN
VRAVNLIPTDSRRTGGGPSIAPQSPAILVLGLLAVAVAFVTIYVLTSNTISSRKANLAQIQAEVAQQQAESARLANYAQFAQLAQARVQTVRQIAATRFDWHGALSDLAKVVPANTSLQSLTGTVSPSAGGAGAGGGAVGAGLRSAISAPAFEMAGCTATQDDVARLISRLRLINGVTRVTLGSSAKQDSAQSGATVSTTAASTNPSEGCGANAPSFDLVVFFTPIAGVGPSGASPPAASQPVSSSSPAATTPASTPASGVPNTPASTTPTTPSTASPVSNPSPAGSAK